MRLSERRDARRLAMAAGAAVLVHVALFVAVPFLTSLDAAPLPDYGPVVIRIELPEATLETAPPVVEPVPRPEPAPKTVPAAKPAPKPAAKPATAATAAAAPSAPTRAAGTSAFRQAGAATGTSAGPVDPSSNTSPPAVDLPLTSGGSNQRSGVAVSLTSRSTGGTLETGKLDKSLAGAATTGAATVTPGTAPTAGAGTPTASSDASIAWKDPDTAEGRMVTFVQAVRWPEWVKESGEELEVRIEFSVNADGVVSLARVAQGSIYPDVNDACLTALRKYRFTPSRGAADIQGVAVFSTVLKR